MYSDEHRSPSKRLSTEHNSKLISMKFGRLLSFRGRISRSTFWWTIILVGFAFIVLMLFLETVLGRPSTLVLYPPLCWILLVATVKRLRDRGKSPAWLLILLIPLLGPLWLLIDAGFRKGTMGDNQYGSDPLESGVDYLTVN
jgi:uncharacterized membrane protein YhaH (DUF805 family)